MEGLLDATSGADPDLLLRYRECHLLVLKALQDGRAYGPQWCNKQITRCAIYYPVIYENIFLGFLSLKMCGDPDCSLCSVRVRYVGPAQGLPVLTASVTRPITDA